MALVAGGLNLVLAAVYWGIGSMVSIDMEKQIRRRGYSHFGVAWLTIMFTCGAHHLVHGIHLISEGRGIGGLDVVAVLMGIPAGATWSLLRIEAVRGGRGDRFIKGTPMWLEALAAAYAALTIGVAALSIPVGVQSLTVDTRLLPNILLVVLYLGIGAGLLRGQLRNRRTLGGWSTSGLGLMMIFPTCAIMHGVYVAYSIGGLFAPDYHGLWVDWISIPSALYFFWIVTGMENGTITDWNEKFEAIDDDQALDAAPLPSQDKIPVGAGGR